MPASVVHDFVYSYGSDNDHATLTTPVTIPLEVSVEELTQRLVQAHHIPCYVEKGLEESLAEFVDQQRALLDDENGEAALSTLDKVSVDTLVDRWCSAFTQEVSSFAATRCITNELVFSEVYHSLIHSPALHALLAFEQSYASAVERVTKQRDLDLAQLERRQRREMETAVSQLGVTFNDDQINQLAQQHFDNRQMLESKWASELSSTQDCQKREYKQWVMQVHSDKQTNIDDRTCIEDINGMLPVPSGVECENPVEISARREESFTVHLGAQLKTTHNLRLISADVLDLCRHKSPKVEGTVQPQRLQTAMSLYSNSLCGLVLLVDNRLNSYTGVKREFARVCEQSTDFHFDDLERQFEEISVSVVAAADSRPRQEDDAQSFQSSGSGSSEKDERSMRLQCGDFYITRHSNIAEVHVVFHMVVDENINSATFELTSRHAAILGYRNILKTCFRCGIHNITLPLLLAHEMAEEMTIAWCMKRAELVFKCVKGFMMELDTWSSQQSTAIQFLLPKGLSEETFTSINNMLPSIFRMSNPVIGKTS